MANIILTGSTGYLGTEIKKFYKNKGDKIFTIGRHPSSDYIIDFNNPSDIENFYNLNKIDKIIHCAAINETEHSNNIWLTYNINVTFTRLLLELAKKNRVKEFIYISTFHVYGSDSGEITEKSPTHPKNDYGLTHLLSEELVSNICTLNNIGYKILRPTNIFGLPTNLSQFSRWTLVPFAFTKEAFDHSKVELKSSGLQQRNFVDIENVLANLDVKYNGIINIYGDTYSIRDFALEICKIVSELKKEPVELIIPKSDEKQPSPLKIQNSAFDYTYTGNLKTFVENLYSALATDQGI